MPANVSTRFSEVRLHTGVEWPLLSCATGQDLAGVVSGEPAHTADRRCCQ